MCFSLSVNKNPGFHPYEENRDFSTFYYFNSSPTWRTRRFHSASGNSRCPPPASRGASASAPGIYSHDAVSGFFVLPYISSVCLSIVGMTSPAGSSGRLRLHRTVIASQLKMSLFCFQRRKEDSAASGQKPVRCAVRCSLMGSCQRL